MNADSGISGITVKGLTFMSIESQKNKESVAIKKKKKKKRK